VIDEPVISGGKDAGDLSAPLADKIKVAAMDDEGVSDAGGVEAWCRQLVDILLPFAGDGFGQRAFPIAGLIVFTPDPSIF
jgi:hypothetical protein